jgi:hypothetical protein
MYIFLCLLTIFLSGKAYFFVIETEDDNIAQTTKKIKKLHESVSGGIFRSSNNQLSTKTLIQLIPANKFDNFIFFIIKL